ncbi:hypothetical protein R1sor_011817 [Riccia sorocarpa]|uniref:Chloride channel protein n=1 Tax=Riccia sorocarpa TaxID=122646 RepID=A0ABD3I395_9MARC
MANDPNDTDDDLEQPLLGDTTEESLLDGHRRGEIWTESLDYEPIQSRAFAYQKKQQLQIQRHLYGFTGVTLAKWLITLTIGFLVGMVAYVISTHQELVTIYKKRGIMLALNNGYGIWVAFAGYCAFGILVVVIASCLVIFWTPAAAGGGVTLVMAYLNGNDVPDFFCKSTLFAKIIGTLCTVSSGLPIGQEGPMVHIGGGIASSLTWMQNYLPRPRRTEGSGKSGHGPFGWLIPRSVVFDFHNDYDRREFISAGAAAGLAAAFGSPIGGVLFALEEASSFWSKKVMWRSLLATSIATLVLSWLHEKEFSFALPGTMSFHNLKPEFVLGDLPLFVITSAVTGAIGSLVNAVHAWLGKNIRPPSDRKYKRLVEAIVVTFIIIVMMFVLAHFFGTCHYIPEGEVDVEEFWFQFTCPDTEEGPGMYNDLASLYLAVPRQTIQKLFRLEKGNSPAFAKTTLGVHFVSWFIIFSLAYGIATPGGIFLPCMVVGSSCGGLLGLCFKILFPSGDVQPGLHALIGATAMLASMFRTSISVVVIIVEGTGGIDFILPLILAVVISNWVAHHLHHESAYEIDLDSLGTVTFLHNEPSHGMIPMTAKEIMSPDVKCLPEVVSVSQVKELLTTTRHNGFPVLRYTSNTPNGGPTTQGTFVGLILRHQLLLLLEEREWIEVDYQKTIIPTQESSELHDRVWELDYQMRIYHHLHHPHRRYLSSRAEEVKLLNLDKEELDVDAGQQKYDGNVAPPQQNGIFPVQASAAETPQQNSGEARVSSEENVIVIPVQQPIEETPSQNGDAIAVAPRRRRIKALDLRPFMNCAPLTVREECSAQRVFIIFRTLGLRHLCVVDAYNRPVGMITRKNIAAAHRRTHQVAKTGDPTNMYHRP